MSEGRPETTKRSPQKPPILLSTPPQDEEGIELNPHPDSRTTFSDKNSPDLHLQRTEAAGVREEVHAPPISELLFSGQEASQIWSGGAAAYDEELLKRN